MFDWEYSEFTYLVYVTLIMIKQKLADFEQSTSLAHCSPLASALLQGLEKRFGFLLNLESSANEYIVAAISHPFFKLRWVPADFVDRCRVLFRTQCQHWNYSASIVAATAADAEDEFFTFAASGPGHQSIHSKAADTICCLNTRNTWRILPPNSESSINIFMSKHYTHILSSAPVERLFSFGGLIHTAKRNRLSDEMFKTLLMLKANDNLCV